MNSKLYVIVKDYLCGGEKHRSHLAYITITIPIYYNYIFHYEANKYLGFQVLFNCQVFTTCEK